MGNFRELRDLTMQCPTIRCKGGGLGVMSVVALILVGNSSLRAQVPSVVDPQSGLRLLVATEDSCPTLRVLLPGEDAAKGGIVIVYPEHVTVREHEKADARHLYLWRPGQACRPVTWRKIGQSLEYEMDLEGDIHMLSRITLDADGVRYHVEFTNRSDLDYDRVEAIWDPRLKESVFHDVRLERTYVHRRGHFELIASDAPERLTMPLEKWLPVRYLDSYMWPVPPSDERIVKDEAGITYRNASEPVDLPVIATVSPDGRWVAASYSKDAGNVWTNPDLTCLHVNPETSLKPHGRASVEGETFIYKGSLAELIEKTAGKE